MYPERVAAWLVYCVYVGGNGDGDVCRELRFTDFLQRVLSVREGARWVLRICQSRE